GLIRTLELRPERMAAQLEAGLLATELADYLVRRGLPFREAHHIVGRVVRHAEEKDMALTDLPAGDLAAISPLLDEGAAGVLSIPAALAARTVTGGTAPAALAAQLDHARRVARPT